MRIRSRETDSAPIHAPVFTPDILHMVNVAHLHDWIRAHNSRVEDALATGTRWLTAAEFAELAGLAIDEAGLRLKRWEDEGALFTLTRREVLRVPEYLLGSDHQPLPVAADVIRALRHYNPKSLAIWFESTASHLDGRRPRDLIKKEPQLVLAAARAVAESTLHPHG